MASPFSRPGSRTVYTTAPRYGLPKPSDVPDAVSPASYDNNKNGIVAREENVAPFDTSAIRGLVKYDDIPGPGRYNPWKRPRVEIGTLPFKDRGLTCPDTKYNTAGPGPAYRVPDPWIRTLVAIYHDCFTKRPRVQYEKFVSNNAPTICHPQDVRCFVQGGDGRMYPWRRPKYVPKIPGPKYNTYGIHTSKSPGPFITDFRNVAERGDVFKPVKGFGAADFDTSGNLETDRGVFLGQTDDPNRSIPRYFETMMRRARLNVSPGPLEYWLLGSFDKMSPKAVSAPFKSKSPMLAFSKERPGPGPAAYFDSHMTEADLEFELFPYHTGEPPEKAPFDTTAERFAESLYEQRPAPNAYCIHGFTDMLRYFTFRHRPALINPKLGFLTSADARPKRVFRHSMSLDQIIDRAPEVPGKWRNLRPRKIPTYPYHGAPPKGPDSPGPIYDANPGCKAIKARKDWFDPRDYTGTGFDNSGCGRVIDFALDKGIPGPKYMPTASIPDMSTVGGRVNTSERRFVPKKPFGPGPRHKPHEKTGSMWRATQLGSYNTYLKGIGELRPSAGGYQPQGPIDHLADIHQGYLRPDDYAGEVNPKTVLDG